MEATISDERVREDHENGSPECWQREGRGRGGAQGDSWTEIARLVGQRNLSVNGGLHYEEGTSVNGVLISTC